MAVNNWSQLYAESVADVSDVAEEIGKAQGGYYETAHAVANDGAKWIAVPYTILGVLFANRTSWFKDVGSGPDTFPQTWDEYRAVGKQLKAKDRPYGQTLAHAFGDGPAFWYPVPLVLGRQGGRGRRQDRRGHGDAAGLVRRADGFGAAAAQRSGRRVRPKRPGRAAGLPSGSFIIRSS